MANESVEINLSETNALIRKKIDIKLKHNDTKDPIMKQIVSDFVVTGYVRKHSNYCSMIPLRPLLLYGFIAPYYDYYASQEAENILRSFIHYKENVIIKGKVTDAKKQMAQTSSIFSAFFIFVLLSIFFIIAFNDDRTCSSGQYTVDPSTFLIVGNIFVILHIVCYVMVAREESMYKESDEENKFEFIVSVLIRYGSCLTHPFVLIWCIIGFIEYGFEISYDCKHSVVGITFISWCIIAAILMFIGYIYFHYQLFLIAYLKTDSDSKLKFEGTQDSILILYFAVLSLIFIIVTSIADGDQCNDAEYDFINDPATFLYIMNCVVLFGALLYACSLAVISFAIHDGDMREDSKKECRYIGYCFSCMRALAATLYLIWCIFGFVTYQQQMSQNCRSSNIATIFLTWCIIMFVSIVLSAPMIIGSCAPLINYIYNKLDCDDIKIVAMVIVAACCAFGIPLTGIVISATADVASVCNGARIFLGIFGGFAICWTICGAIFWKEVYDEDAGSKFVFCGGGCCGFLIFCIIGFSEGQCDGGIVDTFLGLMSFLYFVVTVIMFCAALCFGVGEFCDDD
eukprot:251415_1